MGGSDALQLANDVKTHISIGHDDDDDDVSSACVGTMLSFVIYSNNNSTSSSLVIIHGWYRIGCIECDRLYIRTGIDSNDNMLLCLLLLLLLLLPATRMIPHTHTHNTDVGLLLFCTIVVIKFFYSRYTCKCKYHVLQTTDEWSLSSMNKLEWKEIRI